MIESLVDKSLNEKIDFIGFDYERGKTGVSLGKLFLGFVFNL